VFDIIGKRFWFLLISGIVLLISIVSLIGFGLKAGVEFSSGSILTVRFEQEVEQEQLKQEIANLGHANAIIQRTGDGNFLIRTRELSGEDKTQLFNGQVWATHRGRVFLGLADGGYGDSQ